MKLFIDTANLEEIRNANDMGIISGVTTNPSLIAREGKDVTAILSQIAMIVDGPVNGEVQATTVRAEDMAREGRQIAKMHPNMVVKIPMTRDGLKAVNILSKEGIKTNVTLVFSANQALLAASIRNTVHVTNCALAGADIATVPYKILLQMIEHPLTDQGIEKFQRDYQAVFGGE